MARKITMNGHLRKPMEEVFDDFIMSQTAQGLSDITIATYRHHIRSISNHLDIQKPLEALTRKDLEAMVVSMRVAGLAHNSISSYCRVLRTFLNWCRRGGMNVPELPNIKDKETVKEAYTDAELLALLKRPSKSCSFNRSAIQPMIPMMSEGFCLRKRRISVKRPQIRCSALSRIEQVLIKIMSASVIVSV